MEKILKRTKKQVVVVTVPINSPAGVPIEASIKLDPDYDLATGVQVCTGQGFSTSGVSYVDCGLRDNYGQIEDDCHMENLQASSSVAPNNKFKDVNIKSDGRTVYCRVIPPALNTVNAFTMQFIFRLEDTHQVVARL